MTRLPNVLRLASYQEMVLVEIKTTGVAIWEEATWEAVAWEEAIWEEVSDTICCSCRDVIKH